MIRRSFLAAGLLVAGLTLGTGMARQAISQGSQSQPASVAASFDPTQYVMNIYWIEAVRKPIQPASPLKVGPPISIIEGEKRLLDVKPLMDLTPALYRADRRWKFSQAAAFSIPFAKTGVSSAPIRLSTPDGDFTLRPVSLEKGKQNQVVAKFDFAGFLKSGRGAESKDRTLTVDLGKAYNIAGGGPSDFSYQYSVFVGVTRGIEEPEKAE